MEAVAEQKPIYRQIADRLASELEAACLVEGTPVISVRRLAQREGVSVPTAIAALRQLESLGLIVAKPRSGWRIAPRPAKLPPIREVRSRPITVSVRAIAGEVFALKQRPLVPLGAGVPQGNWLPRTELNQAVRIATQRLGEAAHTYSYAPGDAELRRRLAKHLAAKGITVTAEDLMVTAGATEAIELALKAVAQPGDLIAVESPCYFGYLMLLERLGLRAIEIRTDPALGLDVDSALRSIDRHRPAALIASPSLQNPTGASMPLEARRRLVSELAQRSAVLIEDDTFGDLALNGLAPCKAYDANGSVIYCGTASKTIAPGWRLGWIIGGRWSDEILSQRIERSIAGSRLYETALAHFLSGGRYERHLLRLKARIAESRRAIVTRISASFPADTRIAGTDAGSVLWVELPAEVDAVELMREAADHGISFAPGPMFSATLGYGNFIRLNVANDPTPRLLAAIDTLGRLAARAARRLDPIVIRAA